MKQIEVEIMQQSYVLSCPDGQETRLLEAVERVDSAMTTIRDAGKVRSRDRIAVLAALQVAFELADQASLAQAQALEAQEMAAAAAAAPTDAVVAAQAAVFSDTYAEILQGIVQRLDEGLGELPASSPAHSPEQLPEN